MTITSTYASLRVFLFKRESVDAFHLRLAIDLSTLRCDLHVLDQNHDGFRRACSIIRSATPLSNLVLLEQDRRGGSSVQILKGIRELPELNPLPVVVLGDGDDPDSEGIAWEAGADAFVPLPTRASDLARTGRDIAKFWSDHQLAMTA